MVPPPRRPSRQALVPATEAVSAEALLEGERWRTIAWRRVRAADGPAARLHGRNNQHMPGQEVWLVGERRASGEQKYYVSNLPAETSLKRLAAAIKARWVCEEAHQQLKEELGLDHFEGRSWTGLHRHALMTLIAFAFLQHRRLAAAGRGEKERAAASAEPASRAAGHRGPAHPHPPPARTLPALPTAAHAAPAHT